MARIFLLMSEASYLTTRVASTWTGWGPVQTEAAPSSDTPSRCTISPQVSPPHHLYYLDRHRETVNIVCREVTRFVVGDFNYTVTIFSYLPCKEPSYVASCVFRCLHVLVSRQLGDCDTHGRNALQDHAGQHSLRHHVQAGDIILLLSC